MVSEHEVKKIVKKWQPFFLDEAGVTGFFVSQHGIFISLENESFREQLPDSIEGQEIQYSFPVKK